MVVVGWGENQVHVIAQDDDGTLLPPDTYAATLGGNPLIPANAGIHFCCCCNKLWETSGARSVG